MTRSRSPALSDAARDTLPSNLGDFLCDQRYASYSREEHDVWRLLLERTQNTVARRRDVLSKAYLEGLEALSLPDHIPQLDELNERLARTGWSVVCVDGYVPTSTYSDLIARSVFPVARKLRRREHITYSPMPDMAHDVLGHLPMLFSAEFGRFLRAIARAMATAEKNPFDEALFRAHEALGEAKSAPAPDPATVAAAEAEVSRVHGALARSPSELTRLGRMYLWSIEFGLLGNPDDFRIHGAGILSAADEVDSLAERRAPIDPYSIAVVERDISFSTLQPRYFVAESVDQMLDVLAEFGSRTMADRMTKASGVIPVVRPPR